MATPDDRTPPSVDDDQRLLHNGRLNGTGSLGTLFRQLADDGRTLVKQEIALAKAEVRSNVTGLARGAVIIGLGAAVLLVGLFVLVAFAVIGLGILLDDRYWLSSLIVGGGLALIGLITILVGRGGMQKQDLKPNRTIDTLRDNTDWARAEVREFKQELTRSEGEP